MPEPRDAVEELEADGLTHADALAAVQRRHDASIAAHGFVVHIVPDQPDSPTGFSCHTHGLPASFGHPDFEVVLPLPYEAAGELLARLVARVKAGARYAAGDREDRVADAGDVAFAAATECGRDVLRVIVPDPRGRTARGEIDGGYAVQWEGTE
jgi:hypothetical protein